MTTNAPLAKSQTTSAILSLGSNQRSEAGDSKETLQAALKLLSETCGTITQVSSIYTTSPLAIPPSVSSRGIEQNNFHNIVATLETSLAADLLLNEILKIEQQLGRDRNSGVKWGPRTIDIDIVTYGSLSIDTPELKIPHPQYRARDFVLRPLEEIEPDFRDPIDGIKIHNLLEEIEESDKTIISSNKL